MKLRILLIALISCVIAQDENSQRSVRTPQGHIKYDDPNGLKVNWKFFAPQNQWRSDLENSQRAQRAEANTAQPHQSQPQYQPQPQSQSHLIRSEAPVHSQSSDPNQQYYKPFSAVPSQIKQLIFQTYGPQKPYVDPTAFIYNSNLASPQYDQQSSTAHVSDSRYEEPSDRYHALDQQKLQSRRDYGDRGLQGKIEYKEDYEQQQYQEQQYEQQQYQQQEQQRQQQQLAHQISVPIESTPVQSAPSLVFDKGMPTEIQKILQYQSQLPYDVIANRILYKPKTLFIPKPLSDDVKGPHYYRSKVYYLKNDEIEPEYENRKPIEDDQRH